MEFALIIGWRVAIFNTFRAYPASSVPRTSAIPSLFDSMVIHHLLNTTTSLAIKVGQVGWLRVDLFRTDLRVRDEESAAPLHLIYGRYSLAE